jgi:glycosyltransferase involved in cell wall biosynthesis
MACGVPLVSTKVGQASEIVDDGLNGFLVDAENVENLTEKTLAISRNDSIQAQFRDQGIIKADRFSHSNLDVLWGKFFHHFVEINE